MSNEIDSIDAFGTANLDGNFENYKFFQLHEPDFEKGDDIYELVLRLLPAMHSYRDTGEWNFYYGQHYGHYGINSRNPEKPRARPFKCIQERDLKTKKILVACPKCTQIDKFKSQLKAREHELLQQLQAKNPSITDTSPEFKDLRKGDTKAQALSQWLRKNNCDRKVWINVMDRSGNFGVLKLSYTTFKDVLKPFLKELRDKQKVDVFNPAEGRWLRFTRTGRNPTVKDKVEVFTEMVEADVPGVGKTMVPVQQKAPMTKEQIKKALKICPDLSKDAVKVISAEIMQKLIDSDGSPEATDRIWPDDKRGEVAPAGLSDPDEGDDIEATVTATTTTAAPTTPAVVATTPSPKAAEPEVDDEEAAAMALIAKKQAERAAKTQVKADANTGLGGATEVATDPKTFLEQFGLE